MSDVEKALAEQHEQNVLRAAHRNSGLWDDPLLERYVNRRDLVAFMDETHRALPNGQLGYYGMSAVVFHADDLPEIRRDLETIAGGSFWHAKEAAKSARDDYRIADMSSYIASRSDLPVMVFDMRPQEITESQERPVRDDCLRRAMQVLDEQGVTDVVLDQFPARFQHNVQLDQAVLRSLKATGAVDDQMWMHHARMSEEHALWSADTVAWAVQRHNYGTRASDSRHVAPLSGRLQEVHARSGVRVDLTTAPRADLAGSEGRVRRGAPITSMNDRLNAARRRAQAGPGARSPRVVPGGQASRLDMPKAPPIQGPEGPSRSL